MDIKFAALSVPNSGTLVIGITEDLNLTASAEKLDTKTEGALSRALKLGHFKGKKGEYLDIVSPAGTSLDYIILAGLGKEKELSAVKAEQIGGNVLVHLNRLKIKQAAMLVEGLKKNKNEEYEIAAHIGHGAVLRSYRFDQYRTREKKEDKPTLQTITLLLAEEKKAKAAFAALEAVAAGVFLTRDVVTEPPNVIYPETLAERARELTKLGVQVEVLGEAEMRKLGMGSLLGVAQGSAREPKLVVLQWNGAAKSSEQQPIAFVGKGVTFDTGGISLKPSTGMEDMKYDMGGSAVVLGLMKALAERKAKVNAIGIMGLVENMPGGNAQRPSDVVKSMSGQTIEVLNTDAEGRLVLADALWYCQDRFKPACMIDLATLTGAITITFGSIYAGLFSNDDKLAGKLLAASEKVEEKLWRLPIGDAYDKMINSEIADMQNISNEKGAGSITAAQFLKRFVNDVPWAHLDIAGVTWARKDHDITPKGATAFGVRLLNQFVADYYEGK